jgi:hypothetical protein
MDEKIKENSDLIKIAKIGNFRIDKNLFGEVEVRFEIVLGVGKKYSDAVNNAEKRVKSIFKI